MLRIVIGYLLRDGSGSWHSAALAELIGEK
jgi:hypothetical protein